MHLDKLEYDWWKRDLPTTLGDKRNYVLIEEELAAYCEVLESFATAIEQERVTAKLLLNVIRTKKLGYGNHIPRLFTLAHILEFMLKLAKVKLCVLNFLNDLARRRNEQRSPEQTHEGSSHTDS